MRYSKPLCFLVLLESLQMISALRCQAQKPDLPSITCDFTFQDTVCKNTPVTITNLSQGATTYFWKICRGTPVSFPSGINSGPLPGLLRLPKGVTLVEEGTTFYAFITNSEDSTIIRVKWSDGLLKTPTYDVLQIPDILTKYIFGIQVKNENGDWYGFVTNGASLVRLNFGSSLSNLAPSALTIASSPFMNISRGLAITKDGNNWVGFCTNYPAKTITRFSWGTSLTSNPIVSELGNVGGLTQPMQPALINDASGWYMFVANTTSLSQLNFGNSLSNTPTGINLGNLIWIKDNRGVSVFTQCGIPYALISNHDVVDNQLMQIHFNGGLGGTKTVVPLGNAGNLFEIVALSETLNIEDTLFCIAINAYPSISILYFPPCINSNIPTSTQFDPSPVIFPEVGTYTIKLTVDMGMATEQKVCKEIEVSENTVDLGPDTAICEGKILFLDAGSGCKTYLWNTGETTQSISVQTPGTYSVVTLKNGCTAEDSIHLTIKPNTTSTLDTTICYGDFYYAGGKLQSNSGTYIDTLIAPNGCDHILTTHLVVNPSIPLNIGKDTCMDKGTVINLNAKVSGATDYTWQDGSHDSIFHITEPGLYWVKVFVKSCSKSDSLQVIFCSKPSFFYIPNAFTPNGDGLNDIYRIVASEIVDFDLQIYDRWGQLIFETRDLEQGWDGTFKNRYCEPGVYSYIFTYRESTTPGGNTIKKTGNITLVR